MRPEVPERELAEAEFISRKPPTCGMRDRVEARARF